MQLGAFSISLAVKDLTASREFYERLGFGVMGGDAEQGWLVLRSGTTVIGLFQGMLEKNTLTFTPGWDAAAQNVDPFTDVRELQAQLKAAGVKLDREVDPDAASGPGYFTLTDPDGNPVLVDQHR